MLQFFRKHQKYFFLLVIVVIVTTFVFFGTYQAFAPRKEAGDEVLFETLDGKKVRKGQFAHLCYFLREEERVDGGGNFINDGVISKDLLESRKAQLLYKNYGEKFAPELKEKHAKEKQFHPYVHHQASFLSAENVWGLFAPELKENLNKLQALEEPHFETKVALYLCEKKFPGALLAHILRYQEKDDTRLVADQRLMRDNLNLFGYRDIQDWFGAEFVECCAKTVLQGAALARSRGIHVSKQEVIADLAMKSAQVFQTKKQRMPPQIQSGQALLQAYMYERGYDLDTLASMWQEVLLFRRLFDEVGSSVVCDSLLMKEFYSCAHENVELEVAQMPEIFRFASYADLKRFEHYLQLVADAKKSPLDVPVNYSTLAEIEKREPRVIKTPFVLDVASVSMKELQAKVSLRQTWSWQAESKNQDKIAAAFPTIKVTDLDSLDTKARGDVDSFTRSQIVAEHPEWIAEALGAKQMHTRDVTLYNFDAAGGPLEGIKDQKALKECLAREDELKQYTQDQETFYHIKVKERKAPLILTFEEASAFDLLKEVECENVVDALYTLLKTEHYIENDVAVEKRGDVVAPYRFILLMQESPQEGQFQLIKREEVVSRGQGELITWDQVHHLSENTISKPCINKDEGLYQYKVVAKKTDKTLPLAKMLEAQKMLSDEATYHFFEDQLCSIVMN